MNNKQYFQYSQNNKDDLFDFSKPEGVLVISKNASELPTDLMLANHKLIEYITTYKTLMNDDAIDESVKNQIIDKIIFIIENAKNINYSAFCVYLQVIGYSYSTYKDNKGQMTIDEKRDLVKKLVELYIQNRHDMYLFHGYSDQILQVNSDSSSSRRNGKTGIEKIESMVLPLGFIHAKTMIEVQTCNYWYLLPDKGDINLFDSFLRDNGIVFEFRRSRQNKNPDFFININGQFFIIEHKLTSGGGGAQNAEINEIIDFIKYKEKFDNWHYVSCLQGNYFQRLRKDNFEPKTSAQFNNINKHLYDNENNYFVNGKGLEKLIIDYYKE